MNDDKEQVNVDAIKEAVVDYLLDSLTEEPVLEEDVSLSLRDFLKDVKDSGETVVVD
jgi:hypothetical protein